MRKTSEYMCVMWIFKNLVQIHMSRDSLIGPLLQYIMIIILLFYLLQVSISSSAKYSDAGFPFGYLKASSSMTCVNLFVMPYNYPVLLPLLGE